MKQRFGGKNAHTGREGREGRQQKGVSISLKDPGDGKDDGGISSR